MNAENIPVTASITLDKRRQKKDGTYPVKLFVWDSRAKQGKHLSTGLSLTAEEFSSTWETERPRNMFKQMRAKLEGLQRDAQASIDQLEHFTFDAFERKAAVPKGEASNVFHHFARYIEELRKQGRAGTASSYELAAKSIREFAGKDRLTFSEVTPKFLQDYEDSMMKKGRSMTTVGIYLRPLRIIFNQAIEDKAATRDQYPFGRRRYVIPAGTNPKKALNPEQLRQLRDVHAPTPEQERARAFFFFSYFSNGINVKDIALLRWERIESDRFTFTRAKTRRTKKDKQTAITVYVSGFHHDTMGNYGNDPKRSPYVFPILTDDMDAEQQQKAVKAFTRYLNQHLKKLCKANGLPNISTYWARHSYATMAVTQKKAPMEFMRESLGHSDMKTTLNYFAGFDDEAKKELALSMMDI